MDRLSGTLERNAFEIEEGLRAAYEERDRLRERERELTALIERAQAAVGYERTQRILTLHEAMAVVLRDGGNQWMTTRDLASEVNRRSLYRKRDGSPVESNQIHARAKNYAHMFEKERQLVRLRESTQPRPEQPPLTTARSKYDALRDWLAGVKGDSATMRFDEIADLVGPLPPSARLHQAWWANEQSGSHVQARSWRDAGFRVGLANQREEWVRFIRDEGDDGLSGVREPRRPSPKDPFDEIEPALPDTGFGID